MKFREFLMMLFEADETADNATNNNENVEQNANDNDGDDKAKGKYTDADVDRIINKKFAEWQKKQEKAVAEAEKLANMNAQERAEHERDQWEQKYNELLAKNTRAELTVQARKMLSDSNISGVSDGLVAVLVTDDADTTKANVENFAKMFKEAVQNGIRDLNKKPSPKAGGTSSISKEDIMKIKDVTERQRLIREHMDLFK